MNSEENNLEMGGQPNQEQNPRVKTTTKLLVFVLGLVIGAAVAGAAVGLLMRPNATSDARNSAVAAGTRVVCSNEDVEKYNSLVRPEGLEGFDAKIDALFNDIKDRDGIGDDATCQYIMYAVAFIRGYDDGNMYADNVKELNKRGLYPNNNIYWMQDISQMFYDYVDVEHEDEGEHTDENEDTGEVVEDRSVETDAPAN